MQIKRIVRDVLILVAFCGVFFVVVKAVRMFGGDDASAAVVSEYSADRLEADRQFSKQHFLSASEHYEKLVVADPDNGHAWYNLAMCYESIRARFRIASWKERLATRGGFKSLDPRVPGWESRAAEYGDRAIRPFKKCLDFQRYRNIARINLAEILATKGDAESAMNYLRDAMQDGFFTKEGLRHNPDFATLRNQPGFNQLAVLDRENRRQVYRQQQERNRIQAGIGN